MKLKTTFLMVAIATAIGSGVGACMSKAFAAERIDGMSYLAYKNAIMMVQCKKYGFATKDDVIRSFDAVFKRDPHVFDVTGQGMDALEAYLGPEKYDDLRAASMRVKTGGMQVLAFECARILEKRL